MYDLMYYGGLILSIAMGVVCVVLFFKLNMMEVIDYYFQTNGKYEFNLKKIKFAKKNKDNLTTQKTQEIITPQRVIIDETNATTLLDEEEISLEAAKRYATTLLEDDYKFQQQETEFVLDGVVKSIPTTLL